VALPAGPPAAQRADVASATLGRLLALFGLGGARQEAEALCRLFGDECGVGVSEVSVAYAPDGRPAVRCLAEVVDRRPATSATLDRLQALVQRLITRLGGGASDAARFISLFDAVYRRRTPVAHAPDLRFGLALQWRAASPVALKAYFDLFAAGREEALPRLGQAFALLGLGEYWPAAQSYVVHDGRPACRGFGVDLSPSPAPNLRPYVSGRVFTVARLQSLAARAGGAPGVAALQAFARYALAAPEPHQELPSLLVCPVFAAGLPSDRPALKLDAFLPEGTADDAGAFEAVRQLAARAGVPAPHLDDVVATALHGRVATQTRAVLHYASLDILPSAGFRVGVYLRPFGLETAHLTPRLRPRTKEASLRRLDDAVRAAAGFLERQRASAYAEATHWMTFPHAAGFSGIVERHAGRVFAMALVGNALVDAAHAGFPIDWNGLEQDADRLLEMRADDVPGGWRYFPTLPELPPDADDLAEVLRLLQAVRPERVPGACGEALRLVLSVGIASDGSLRTWIVDEQRTDPATVRLRQFIGHQWGDTADVEVVANLLEALWRLDRARYAEACARGVEFVAGRQAPDGTWGSTWYWGPYYGTFAACRFLAAAWPGHPALHRAAAGLRAALGADGSALGPTDLALAMLAAAALRSSVPFEGDRLRESAASLLARQEGDGSWPATPFIRMDTNRVRTLAGKGQPRYVSYSSRTTATAFCLRALCAARPALLDRDP
jgi:squalene-hopene/tetraprenyl-beta-curcumene cyclase